MPFLPSKYFSSTNKADDKRLIEDLKAKYQHTPELKKEFKRQSKILKELDVPLATYLLFLEDVFLLDQGQKSPSGHHYKGGLYEILPSEIGRSGDKLTKLFSCKEVIRYLSQTNEGINLLQSDRLDHLEKKQNIISFINGTDHPHAQELSQHIKLLGTEPKAIFSASDEHTSDRRSHTSSGDSHISTIEEAEEEIVKAAPQSRLDNPAAQHKTLRSRNCIIM